MGDGDGGDIDDSRQPPRLSSRHSHSVVGGTFPQVQCRISRYPGCTPFGGRCGAAVVYGMEESSDFLSFCPRASFAVLGANSPLIVVHLP